MGKFIVNEEIWNGKGLLFLLHYSPGQKVTNSSIPTRVIDEKLEECITRQLPSIDNEVESIMEKCGFVRVVDNVIYHDEDISETDAERLKTYLLPGDTEAKLIQRIC
jgi:hypothetical protein